jgi:predicted transcriptional regulator
MTSTIPNIDFQTSILYLFGFFNQLNPLVALVLGLAMLAFFLRLVFPALKRARRGALRRQYQRDYYYIHKYSRDLHADARGARGILSEMRGLLSQAREARIEPAIESAPLSEPEPAPITYEYEPQSEDERAVLNTIGAGEKHTDEITRESGLSARTVSSTLMMLQLTGAVSETAPNTYKVAMTFDSGESEFAAKSRSWSERITKEKDENKDAPLYF